MAKVVVLDDSDTSRAEQSSTEQDMWASVIQTVLSTGFRMALCFIWMPRSPCQLSRFAVTEILAVNTRVREDKRTSLVQDFLK